MKEQYIKKYLFFYALLFLPKAYSANSNFSLKVEGLNGDLQRNIHACLSSISNDEITFNEQFQNRIDNILREGLRALGYYSPTIDFIFQPAVNNDNNVLITRINPGKPVKIASVNITLHGEAQQDNDYQQLISDGKSMIGNVLNHNDYDKFKNRFSSLALAKGYFDAEFCQSQLGVALSRYQAYWNIDFDSGKRYRLGKVNFHGAQIREDYLQNIAKIREGEPYSAELLADLNYRLTATNWFNSVSISPIFNIDRQSKILPLEVIVTPRKRNNIEAGIGYTTNIGAHIKTTWIKPWFNSRGHSLQTNFSLSAPEQSGDISYKIPLLTDPLEQYYFLQGGFKSENLNNIQSNTTTFSIARYWNLSSNWQRTINFRWSLNSFTRANITDHTMLIYPGMSINKTNSQHSTIIPNWGNSQRYSIDISNIIWGSDINFIIFQAQNAWIRTLAEKHRFVIHSNLGWIKTNDFKYIPPSLRFFAGGDHSIRGYRYKSISPHDDNGKLIGSSKIATCSIEYQYNIANKWWNTIFIDTGEAVDDIKKSHFKTGAGIGIQWQSLIGSVKLSIATPLFNNYNHEVQFYVGFGPEL